MQKFTPISCNGIDFSIVHNVNERNLTYKSRYIILWAFNPRRRVVMKLVTKYKEEYLYDYMTAAHQYLSDHYEWYREDRVGFYQVTSRPGRSLTCNLISGLDIESSLRLYHSFPAKEEEFKTGFIRIPHHGDVYVIQKKFAIENLKPYSYYIFALAEDGVTCSLIHLTTTKYDESAKALCKGIVDSVSERLNIPVERMSLVNYDEVMPGAPPSINDLGLTPLMELFTPEQFGNLLKSGLYMHIPFNE